jgi:hypothetical protein
VRGFRKRRQIGGSESVSLKGCFVAIEQVIESLKSGVGDCLETGFRRISVVGGQAQLRSANNRNKKFVGKTNILYEISYI